MKTSEILNTAADLIQIRGWRSGAGWYMGDDQAGLCLEGGIQAAMGHIHKPSVDGVYAEFKACPAYRAVQSYLGWEERRNVFDFNDACGRTDAEVIEVLRAVALVEEAKEAEEVSVP